MSCPVVHFEIGCKDSAKTAAFFADVFGWKIDDGNPARMIEAAGEGGIPGHITSLGHEPHNYVNIYIEVDDIQAYLDKVEANGGQTMIPPTEIPGGGAFAWFTAPEGNMIGLWKP